MVVSSMVWWLDGGQDPQQQDPQQQEPGYFKERQPLSARNLQVSYIIFLELTACGISIYSISLDSSFIYLSNGNIKVYCIKICGIVATSVFWELKTKISSIFIDILLNNYVTILKFEIGMPEILRQKKKVSVIFFNIKQKIKPK